MRTEDAVDSDSRCRERVQVGHRIDSTTEHDCLDERERDVATFVVHAQHGLKVVGDNDPAVEHHLDGKLRREQITPPGCEVEVGHHGDVSDELACQRVEPVSGTHPILGQRVLLVEQVARQNTRIRNRHADLPTEIEINRPDRVRPMPEVVVPLTVRDLTAEDLPACAWAGSGPAQALERVELGEVDYLVVCPPSGIPVATGGVDYTLVTGAGTLWQLSVHEALRSCGIGTILIHAAEQRIRARGLKRSELGVDERIPRPRGLYERLGYAAYGREPGAWDQKTQDGSITLYETTIILMRKDL